MKTCGVKMNMILPIFLLAVITCFTGSAWADSSPYYSMNPTPGYTGMSIAMGICQPGANPSTNTATYSYLVNGTSPIKAFTVTSGNTASAAATYYMKEGTWKIDIENNYFNQTLSTYVNITDTQWGFANGCGPASNDISCSASKLMPSPSPVPAGGPNLTPGCQMNQAAVPHGGPSPYYSMSAKDGYTGITMNLGPCGNATTPAAYNKAINTVTYSVMNGTTAQKVFSVDNKVSAPMVIYMKQGVKWQVDVENTYIKQKLTAPITINEDGWVYADNCGPASPDPKCSAAELFEKNDSTTGPLKVLSPGCQPSKYTPPPPPPLVCGDNTQTTGWDDERITIINNCADAAYIVLTPPTANSTYQQYNLDLWKQAAKRINMETMYANPKITTSALMFRKKLASGDHMNIPVPKGGIASGNIGVLLNCQQEPDGVGWPGNCTIGAIPGTASTGVGTIFEYSAGCTYTTDEERKAKCTVNPSSADNYCLGSSDYYDVSMVNGFSVPMNAEVENGKTYDCNITEINGVTDLFGCPSEDNTTISATGNNVQPYNNPQLSSGVNLYISNHATVEGRAACITPQQWLNAGGQNPKNTQLVTLSESPVALNDLTIADWYGCNGMAAGTDPAHPAECTGPGCGGPQCVVGPDGTIGIYTNSNIISGKSIAYTNYVTYLKHIGVGGYAWQFNDDASTVLCKKPGAKIQLTLCPGPEGQKPYEQQNWAFDGKKCLPTKGGSNSTLLDCMKDNYWYTCQQEKVEKLGPDNTSVSADLNYCMPYKTKNDPSAASDGVPLQTYEQCIQYQDHCRKFGPEQ